MARNGPIIFVEDDVDDQEFVREVIIKLNIPNELIFFSNGPMALKFLRSSNVQPLIIFSDVNLPMMTGLEFKQEIDSDPDLRSRSIPFIFLSTSVDRLSVDMAYKNLTVQGFFKKSSGLHDLEDTLRVIIEYWKLSKHPNNL